MKKPMMKDVQRRVSKGLKFMQKEYGRSWLRKVDPEQLALESGNACVLGQVEGDYGEAIAMLGLNDREAGKLAFIAAEETLAGENEDREFELLDKAWRKEIRALQRQLRIKPKSWLAQFPSVD